MSPRPPIAAELAAHLPTGEPSRPFVDGPQGVTELRAAMREYEESVAEVREQTGAQIDEVVVGGVPVIVVRPPAGDPQRGVVLNIHGGGLIAGSHLSVLGSNVRTALGLGCTMVIPDYRLAPEHPYPAALDDVHAVWEWMLTGGLGAETGLSRTVVMGGSAGGLLAASLILRLRERGGDGPDALVLVQPQLDDRNTQPSTHEIDLAHFWDRPSNLQSWAMYLAGTDALPVEAVPARATDLAGFPPTFIEIGQVDLFRDEELEFAARLSRAGVPVEAHLWAGAFHGFDGLTETRTAQRAIADRLAYLRFALSGA
ncbi:alpha/beta hydrolase [Leifsonia poae]|uniref:alpha/beta hydrolase n=1 Tax=Leifsonia poae TaxID=110933 RepID=UPI001CBF8B34|nr:alpha/beta hydrolase [Leifsonia poae]